MAASGAASALWAPAALAASGPTSKSESVWTWIAGAAPALAQTLLLFGLGMLALSIALVPVGWLLALPRRWHWLWQHPVFRWFGPALQIQPFDDSAMAAKIGTAFALLTQSRVGGGREAGLHLYLVTGEQSSGPAIAELQGVPQTQALAAAISLLRLSWRRTRLVVTGSLMPVDDQGSVAVAVALRRNSKFIDNAEFWPSEPRGAGLSPATSNRVLAVAAAGWIEHCVVDQTPGPGAREKFLSADPLSWALFRSGAELNRMSCLAEAADQYEKALALDDTNIGALVDLAHLRRQDRYFDGAEALARSAVDLIEARSRMYATRGSGDDPNWYRAQIVLATIHAEWAKERESAGEASQADALRAKAYERAVAVAGDAMDSRDRLEAIFGKRELEDAAQGGLIGGRALRSARRHARRAGRSLDAERAVELYVLLGTTFEPAALLLVAATCPRRAQSLPVELRG